MSKSRSRRSRAHRARHLALDADDPLIHQEAHSPTVPVEVRVTAKRTVTRSRRRKADTWLAGLTDDQQSALSDIEHAHRIIVGEVAWRGMSFAERNEAHDWGRVNDVARPMLEEIYLDWVSRTDGRAARVALVTVTTVGGLRAIERAAGVASGTGLDLLAEALDRYLDCRRAYHRRVRRENGDG